jgi:two-component system OmpR family response regulator
MENIEKNVLSILVIEDEEILRVNICEILKHYSYRVIEAASGEEGIHLASTLRPSLIVCDIMLPGIDGYEILRSIRNIPQLLRTPFIFLTAKSTRQDLRAGMELGADDFITKPFTRMELLNSIEARLERLNQIEEKPQHDSDSLMANFTNLHILSRAELRILKEIAYGLTTAQIAEKLYLSKKTIENHRTNISLKLGLHGPNSLIQFAYRIKNKIA